MWLPKCFIIDILCPYDRLCKINSFFSRQLNTFDLSGEICFKSMGISQFMSQIKRLFWKLSIVFKDLLKMNQKSLNLMEVKWQRINKIKFQNNKNFMSTTIDRLQFQVRPPLFYVMLIFPWKLMLFLTRQQVARAGEAPRVDLLVLIKFLDDVHTMAFLNLHRRVANAFITRFIRWRLFLIQLTHAY